MASTLAWSLALTASTPSTLSTLAPRARLAGAMTAGDPGSVYATKIWRGGAGCTAMNCTPYPTFTPAVASASHVEVG